MQGNEILAPFTADIRKNCRIVTAPKSVKTTETFTIFEICISQLPRSQRINNSKNKPITTINIGKFGIIEKLYINSTTSAV
ncbi:hypothetical protein FACS1894125_0150 [Actinomycetota bacterium]|nr:hypothetical protein FACS1894125_0150 [Actinomycetota bacterium]